MSENKEQEQPGNSGQGKGSAVNALVMPHFRVLLLKPRDQEFWSVCSNPTWGYFEKCFSDALQNMANKYIEYENCGVKHRMIRYQDIGQYIYDKENFKPDWALDPDKA